MFHYTICPFFSLVLHFLGAAHLGVYCIVIKFLTRRELTLTPVANCRIYEVIAFFTARVFLARKLSRFLVVLLHSILRSVTPCPGWCFLPCLCAFVGPVKQPMNPLGCVSSSWAARSWSWLPGLIQVASQQRFGCKARSSQPFLVGGNMGGVAQWLKAGSYFPGPERFYGEEEVWAAQAERDMLP